MIERLLKIGAAVVIAEQVADDGGASGSEKEPELDLRHERAIELVLRFFGQEIERRAEEAEQQPDDECVRVDHAHDAEGQDVHGNYRGRYIEGGTDQPEGELQGEYRERAKEIVFGHRLRCVFHDAFPLIGGELLARMRGPALGVHRARPAQEADDVVKLGIAQLELRHLMPIRDLSGLRPKPDLERCRSRRCIAVAAEFLPSLADFRGKARTLAPKRVAVETGVLLPDAFAARHLVRNGVRLLDAPGAHIAVGHEACEDGEEEYRAAVEDVPGGCLGQDFHTFPPCWNLRQAGGSRAFGAALRAARIFGMAVLELAGHARETREQNLVFDADVLVYIGRQLGKAAVQSAPGGAGILRRLEADRKFRQNREIIGVIVMVGAHHINWLRNHGMAAVLQHWKENALLNFHVRFERFGNPLKVVHKPLWCLRMACMGALNRAREIDKRGKLLPVHGVIAVEDKSDDPCRV